MSDTARGTRSRGAARRGAMPRCLGLAGLLALAGWTQQAMAQEMQWERREGEGRLYLAYEVPNTSDQSLLLICDTARRGFSLSYVDERDRVRAGSTARLELASEGGRVLLRLPVENQELGDVAVLSGAVPLDAALLRVLRGQTLRVTLEGETESIPLSGAQPGVAALAAQCGPR
ncbi:hypothetical protein [Teichococcus cervicalis]|nr:hypothetical protein [Pseudoroseomonas cervicalis]